ncbi:glycosyltransferase family 2 protein [Parapedobacter sp. 10938]|uniref:glycosyltransferase family 2 protein n=1 Tax=Parapedobacter flavus TaxID=3110225 RepID=UPI002DB9D192|nr:glycosyltransferase [Parapedobacter sp. 10938]MEC3880162.1 glycosyltransferase [Parapedobacter sp. 10938]
MIPLVSISCATYNHGRFIRQCLDGFLIQKVNFPIEILVHDDASVDGTAEIIKEYANKYPQVIKPLCQTENQFSRGINVTLTYNFSRAEGKYIALCEGDDYWTDSYKLQRQVDFLENNPEFSLACGGFIKRIVNSGEEYIDVIDDYKLFPIRRDGGFEFSLNDLHKKWLTKTLTVIFRKDFLNTDDLFRFKYLRDTHLFHQLIKKGKGFYFTEPFGVYHVHQGGIHSTKIGSERADIAYEMHKELYEIVGDNYSKRKLYEKSMKKLAHESSSRYAIRHFLTLSFRAMGLADSFFEIIKVFKLIFKKLFSFFIKKENNKVV